MLPQTNQPGYANTLLSSAVLNRNAQRAKKAHILGGKRLTAFFPLHRISRRMLLNRIQSNRRFQHQQHVETLLANFLNHPCDLRRLGHGFVYGFPKLLDQALQS
jgi:hypothetical protein